MVGACWNGNVICKAILQGVSIPRSLLVMLLLLHLVQLLIEDASLVRVLAQGVLKWEHHRTSWWIFHYHV